mmetsp:Transcript_12460/g.26370  ORF Transcript_12460/g.26370 Transcript_12460/m.26370 type:complete len:280 (+) Transcript_12460:110-949(+)
MTARISSSRRPRRDRYTRNIFANLPTCTPLVLLLLPLVLLLVSLSALSLSNRDAIIDLSTDNNGDTRSTSTGAMIRGAGENGQRATKERTDQHHDDGDVVILSLQLDADTTVDIRLQLLAAEAPKAAEYVQALAATGNTEETCSKCTLYRGEPVPVYWGSEDYPDQFFDGGRWGPPYALVQGGLISDGSISPPPAEEYNPIIERGMVAWAGGKGGPHFFIALAQHPEWGHGHTVWANVIPDDMDLVDELLSRPLVSTKPKQPPIVTNFVDPIPFRIRSQ